MKCAELVTYLDEMLRVKEIEDSSQNGLQVEGPEEVTKVAFAVDGCQAAFKQAVAAGAQLLIVHHGLFWDKPLRLVGPLFQRVRALIEGGWACTPYTCRWTSTLRWATTQNWCACWN